MGDLWNFLQHDERGRALIRGVKAFIFSFVSLVAVTLVADNSFDGVQWLEILGTSVLTAMGMSAEKYRRAMKNQ